MTNCSNDQTHSILTFHHTCPHSQSRPTKPTLYSPFIIPALTLNRDPPNPLYIHHSSFITYLPSLSIPSHQRGRLGSRGSGSSGFGGSGSGSGGGGGGFGFGGSGSTGPGMGMASIAEGPQRTQAFDAKTTPFRQSKSAPSTPTTASGE
jgi:hypothetical protein